MLVALPHLRPRRSRRPSRRLARRRLRELCLPYLHVLGRSLLAVDSTSRLTPYKVATTAAPDFVLRCGGRRVTRRRRSGGFDTGAAAVPLPAIGRPSQVDRISPMEPPRGVPMSNPPRLRDCLGHAAPGLCLRSSRPASEASRAGAEPVRDFPGRSLAVAAVDRSLRDDAYWRRPVNQDQIKDQRPQTSPDRARRPRTLEPL